jgi:predicted phage-related endonuclease
MSAVVTTSAMSREAWLESRRAYVGASDVGKLLIDKDGHPIHPYGTPLQVWLDKMGLSEDRPSERADMGLMLEPVVVERFKMANPGVKPYRTGTHFGEKEHHASNPDRLIAGTVRQVPGTVLVEPWTGEGALRAIVQVKTAGYFAAQDFGVEGTDEVPDWYLAQVQWELYCTGRDLAVLALLYDTHVYRQFLIYRDEALISYLKMTVDRFWLAHVVPQERPKALSHPADTSWLNTAWSPKPDKAITATPEDEALILRLARQRQRHKEHAAHVVGLENAVKELLQDAAAIQTQFGTLTWKADKNGRRSMRMDSITKALEALEGAA